MDAPNHTPTLEVVAKLMKALIGVADKMLDSVNEHQTAKVDAAERTPCGGVAQATMAQLEESNESGIPGTRAYNAFREYRKGVHTAALWDDSEWLPRWQETYTSRARDGVLTTYQTVILSVLTDDSISASEMRNLIAVLALLPADKVLPFYNFLMYEKMGLEAVDALEHMDTIPVPMHNPRVLADLNCKTLHEYAVWKGTGRMCEGCGASAQPFTLYAEDSAFSGMYREGGVFGCTPQVAQKLGRDIVDSGVRDTPLITPSRLTLHTPSESKGASRASNEKLTQDG